jgi:hypothetical protein
MGMRREADQIHSKSSVAVFAAGADVVSQFNRT